MWSLSVSAGIAQMNLDQVDGDNQRDVDGWNAQGVFVPPFTSVKSALMVAAKATYRFERDIVLSLSAANAQQKVSTAYDTPEAKLSMTRSVGFTDLLFGVAYYFPIAPLRAETYVETEAGVMFARADAEAYGTQTTKVVDSTQTTIIADTKGIFRYTKPIVNVAVGANITILEPFFVRLQAQYKFGNVGTMEGDVTRFGEKRREETTIEFNYSGFLFTLGVGIAF